VEHESNDGFQQAQQIQVPQVIDGQIHADRNVDVFMFELDAQQTLAVEVQAARRGSGLDSLLTLFDQDGNIVGVSDDHAETTDSRLSVTLPSGSYYLSLQDAHDRGGPAQPYRLSVQAEP
jgi:hypothetical protein